MPWAAAGAVAGALISSDSTRKASNTQQNATNQALNEQARQYDQTRADYAPFRAAGVQALGQLQNDIGRMPTSAEVMSDPGYQFGLTQGQQALDRKAAAAGGRVSGAALKAASQYATDYATNGYGAAYQRRQDRLNRLAALAGIGQTSTMGTAQAGAQSSSAVGNLISNQGNATGAAQIAQGNIWGNAANQLGAVGQRWASQPSSSAVGTAGNGGVGGLSAGQGLNNWW